MFLQQILDTILLQRILYLSITTFGVKLYTINADKTGIPEEFVPFDSNALINGEDESDL